MKDSTKEFIKFRPNAKFIEKVDHRPNYHYHQRDCISMAVNEAKAYGVNWVSGWLVDDFREDINATTIIHHCWNIDRNGNHYDTLPVINKNYEYVQDVDVKKPYKVGDYYYISPVIFFNDNKITIPIQDGKQAVISDEEHIRFRKDNERI